MTRIVILVGLAAALMLPTTAHATSISSGDQIKVIQKTGTLGGGPFGIDITVHNNAVVADNIRDFWTFCLERTEGVSVGNTYYVDLQTYAKNGGTDSSIPGDNKDFLDSRTAFLYSQFLDGVLPGYSQATNTLAGVYDENSQLQRNGLQLAIWRLEEELGAGFGGLGAVDTRDYAQELVDYATANANDSLYNVLVMQLWANYDGTTFSGNRQDFLVRTTPVPEAFSTLSALMLGASLVGYARRRSRRPLATNARAGR